MWKRTLFFFIFIGIPFENAWAIPQRSWGPEGIVISTETEGQVDGKFIRSGSSSTIVMWKDYRFRYYGFGGETGWLAQRVGDDGVKQWSSDKFVTSSSRVADAFAIAAPDGSGGALFVWGDNQYFPSPNKENCELYVQRIDSNGNRLWGDYGVAIATGDGHQEPFSWGNAVIPDGTGGGLVIFFCEDSQLDDQCSAEGIYVQKFDNSGKPQLGGLQGVLISTGGPWPDSVTPDGSGGAIISWTQTVNGNGEDIFIQRINNSGVKQWGTDGVNVCSYSGDQMGSHLVGDGSGGTFIFWKDFRSGNSDIYAQRVNSNGEKQWASLGVPVVTGSGNQQPDYYYGGGTVDQDGAGGAIVAYNSDAASNQDIYAQRIVSDGSIVWQTGTGMPVMRTSEYEILDFAVSDGAGGLLVGSRLPYEKKLKVQRIDSSGKRLWPTDGIIISQNDRVRLFTDVLSINATSFLVIWEDGTRDGGAFPAASDLFAQLIIDIPGPEPPSNLTAASLEGRRIKLDWTISPSTNIARYNIYHASTTGIIDYTTLFSSVPYSSSTFVTPPLTEGIIYKFGVRAEDENGVEEMNTNVVASAKALESFSTLLQASIKVPQSGKKVTGNRVTVVAEIIQGSIYDVKNIRFQYRDAITTTTAWQDIIPATFEHSNPDTDFPYFMHWDISSFPEGNYELRTIATNRYDVFDLNPPTIFITVDHADPDLEEIISGTGIQKRQRINNTTLNMIQVGDIQSGALTEVIIPKGVLNTSTTTIKLLTDPSVPPIPGNFCSANTFREITLENDQTLLSSPATLTFEYQDSTNDGYVDGTTARAERLNIYAYNTISSRWEKQSESSVHLTNKTVICQTLHFSLFGLFASAAINLSDVLVYPVPWVPNDGIADNGKPFSLGDPTSGIVFDNITQSVRIQVYSVTGELVWETNTSASSGKVQWNGRNRSGRDTASGGYFAVITDTEAGNRVKRKIVIIR